MVDTGGSYSFSPFKSDITSFHTLDTSKTLTVISSGWMIQGERKVKYMMRVDSGYSHKKNIYDAIFATSQEENKLSIKKSYPKGLTPYCLEFMTGGNGLIHNEH